MWVQASLQTLQIHSLPSSPWFLLPNPSTADGFMSWEQKWLLLNSDYMPLCSTLSFPVAPSLCSCPLPHLQHRHKHTRLHTQPTHSHLYPVHMCLLEFEDKLLWLGSQPARSAVALCRGQGVFAYPQGSGNINKLLSHFFDSVNTFTLKYFHTPQI